MPCATGAVSLCVSFPALQPESRFISVSMASLCRSPLLLVTLSLIIHLPLCPELTVSMLQPQVRADASGIRAQATTWLLETFQECVCSASAQVSHFLSSSIIQGHCIFRKCLLLFDSYVCCIFVIPMFLCQAQEKEWKPVCAFSMF